MHVYEDLGDSACHRVCIDEPANLTYATHFSQFDYPVCTSTRLRCFWFHTCMIARHAAQGTGSHALTQLRARTINPSKAAWAVSGRISSELADRNGIHYCKRCQIAHAKNSLSLPPTCNLSLRHLLHLNLVNNALLHSAIQTLVTA